MTTMNDVFANQEQFLDEVIILPVGSHEGTGFNLPSGYTWDDFEYIEGSIRNTDDAQSYSGSQLTKEEIAANPTSFSMRMSYTQGSSVTAMSVDATSATTFDVTQRGNNSNQRLKYLKGYTKRYSSRNVSAIIDVDGVNPNNEVGVNQRYEIDIRTALGEDYVGRDLIVEAEIYNNSGTGTAGWGNSGAWSRQTTGGSNQSMFTRASTFGDKIIVQTAQDGVTTNSNLSGNPFNISSTLTQAPCRVKVWKVDQFLSPTFRGGAGKTVLYGGSANPLNDLVQDNGNVALSDDALKYDMIQIYAMMTNNAGTAQSLVGSAMFEPEMLNATTGYLDIWARTAGGTSMTEGYVQVQLNASTTTSLRVNEATQNSWAAAKAGIYKVIGIKY